MVESRYRCEYKNCLVYEKHIWNHATDSCENGNYLASIMKYLAIMCDEIQKNRKHKIQNCNF